MNIKTYTWSELRLKWASLGWTYTDIKDKCALFRFRDNTCTKSQSNTTTKSILNS